MPQFRSEMHDRGPVTDLAVPLLQPTILALLAEAGMKWALGSSFYLLAAAATTKSGPRR